MKAVPLHQALHGYRDGHRLLASSLSLTPDDRQLLGRQTDNSDAGRSAQWDALLSGYPLPSGIYAWSMTWPAPEMPRPGCVWTHTLLISPSFEVETIDLNAFLRLFRRPESTQPNTGDYAGPISMVNKQTSPRADVLPKMVRLIAAIIWAFYEEPLRPVRVAGLSLEDWPRHRFLLSLWLQQWSDLRTQISLGDSPVTPKQLNGGTFDLQLHQSSRIQGRSDQDRVVRGVPDAKPPDWASAAAEDIVEPGDLSDFLHAYGSAGRLSRGAFGGLVDLWRLHEARQDGTAVEVIRRLAQLFPDKASGRALKRDVLGTPDPPAGCRRTLSDAVVLTALVQQDDLTAFDPKTTNVGGRVSSIADTNPADLGPVVDAMTDPDNFVAKQVLDGVEDLDERQVTQWARKDPGTVMKIAALRPTITARPVMWKALDPHALWEHARHVRGAQNRADVIRALVTSGSDLPPGDVFEAWRDGPVVTLSVFAEGTAAPEIVSSWLAEIPPRAIVDWLASDKSKDKDVLTSLAIQSLPPTDLARLDPKVVSEEMGRKSSVLFATKVVAAAIRCSNKPRWAPAAMEAFDFLCAPKRRIGGEAKKVTDSLLSDFDGDDPRGRMGRGLNQAFQRDRWDPLEALQLTESAALSRIVEADKKAGLARRIVQAAMDQDRPLARWQHDILWESIDARSDRASLLKWIEHSVGRLLRL